jgi:O-succinylbenzoic acid--CoA ligase
VGGAAVPAALLDGARAVGGRVTATYGMTESAGGCVYDGTPLDGVEIAIDDGGRIAVRGPVLADGYHGRPDLTAAAFRDGWFHSGDIGAWDGDGRLVVLGRADDVIVTGGENVSATMVAGLLRSHPGVGEVAVRGRPDAEWGQRVVAYVVPADPMAPPTLAGLRAHVLAQAGPPAAPREVVLVDSLPLTALGKTAAGG